MDGIPDVAPRDGPDGVVALVELELYIVRKFLFDLQDRRPKGRSGACISSRPKRSIRIIFSFDHCR
jgi:hypothetical protein